MDYKKIYDNLIESRQNLVRKKVKKRKMNYVYYEKHHIIPKSCGGTNDKENLILLTAKEHFIAHLLLTKCYEGEMKIKMCYAFWMMCNRNSKYNEFNELVKISSSTYQYAKELIASLPGFNTGKAPWNKGLTKEMDLRINASKRPKTEEHKQNLSKSKKGWKPTPTTLVKMKENLEVQRIKSYKSISQYDLSGKYIKSFVSVVSASQSISSGDIIAVLKGRTKTAGGFYWTYFGEIPKINNIRKQKESRKVFQYDLNKNFITQWNSASEIKNYGYKNVYACLCGNATQSHGFIWKYEKIN